MACFYKHIYPRRDLNEGNLVKENDSVPLCAQCKSNALFVVNVVKIVIKWELRKRFRSSFTWLSVCSLSIATFLLQEDDDDKPRKQFCETSSFFWWLSYCSYSPRPASQMSFFTWRLLLSCWWRLNICKQNTEQESQTPNKQGLQSYLLNEPSPLAPACEFTSQRNEL